MSDEMERALDARRRQDRRPSAEPRPRHAWIAERLEKLARKDELLRQIGYIKTEGENNADDE